MKIDSELLEILVCPESHQPLEIAEEQLIRELNEKIEKGELKNHSGDTVKNSFSGGLIRQDKKALYPIVDDIPVLLIEERIDL
ncbi:MAG: hypothetical protein D6719_03680 [Candidatus Dadabacteria bacterium]|nr:MAG: hypothetical protein D6719_03680 [Candidatus Dadabacteria bacterium]